ncbi:MAG TPA: chemotaxis protein CheD [Thermoanaerobaculia bacterium]|nr:chemotaxis protein CheD [Thermoanaerobaculia bacterium]
MSSLPLPAAEEAPESVYVHPGQLYTASHSALVSTVLGSCVAVCLWDPIARVGGVNHFLLPTGKGPRYGNEAVPALIDAMVERGAFVARMVAKVFGGACVIEHFTGSRRAIGEQNTEAALRSLAAHAIPVRVNETGGRRGRKLLFHTGTGHAYVKEI